MYMMIKLYARLKHKRKLIFRFHSTKLNYHFRFHVIVYLHVQISFAKSKTSNKILLLESVICGNVNVRILITQNNKITHNMKRDKILK